MNIPAHIITGGIFTVMYIKFVDIRNALGFFYFASFLDIDHYIYYILKFRKLELGKAVEYFNSKKNSGRFCLCIFHTVEFFVLFGLLTYFSTSSFLYACFLGFLLHNGVDVAQALYYRRMHYRWWSMLGYFSSITRPNTKI